MSFAKYPDIFYELKTEVRAAGLLERVPVRGTIEMIAVLLSVVVVSVIVHRRRHIWRRKTSDDQFQVLYTKNLQPTEASQNV